MTIHKRTILDRCEVLPSGHIQVRHCIEEFDDTITPTPAVEGVYRQVEVSPADLTTFPPRAPVFETVTVTEPVESITDLVEEVIFHRCVIDPEDATIAPGMIVDGVILMTAKAIAAESERFMQTHKMIPCPNFDLYDRRYPDGLDSVP